MASYARQFLGRMERPKVDHVERLSPPVSIDQKSSLRWARLGTPTCPECGAAIETWAVDRIADAILAAYADQPVMVLAPVIRERKGEYRKELSDFRARGFVRARIDGEVKRLKAEADKRSRIAEAVEQALALADGLVAVVRGDAEGEKGEDYRIFSTQRACPNGHGSIPEMEPRLFSFNSPMGACPACDGLGTVQSFSEELLVRDASLSLATGALHVITDEGRLV